MNRTLIALFSFATVLSLGACGGTTLIDDPVNNDARSVAKTSYAEYAQAARAACNDALSSPVFANYLKSYQKQKGEDAIPLMEVTTIRNETTEPNLKTELMTDEMFTTMLNSGLVNVTKATGSHVAATTSDARNLKRDPNFDQSTVQQKGTLIAPDISLEGAIIDNKLAEGRTTNVTRSFNLRIINLKTGMIVWSYNKPLAFEKTRPVFGY